MQKRTPDAACVLPKPHRAEGVGTTNTSDQRDCSKHCQRDAYRDNQPSISELGRCLFGCFGLGCLFLCYLLLCCFLGGLFLFTVFIGSLLLLSAE